jgi:hypothetical protein
MSPQRSSQRRPSVDLDEIAPNRFLIHEPRVRGVIKDEGTIEGQMFTLTSWRREGLLARLRERQFRVRTIADRIDALPGLPPPPLIGPLGWRPLTSAIEQISHFDLRNLRWHPLATETRDGMPGVLAYEGWVLRRRKGRGSASYFLAFVERGGDIGLKPLDETKAILTGYAQALALDDRPLLAEHHPSSGAGPDGDRLLLPEIILPPAYREVLRIIASSGAEGWLVDRWAWPLAQDLFGRLGMRLAEAGD